MFKLIQKDSGEGIVCAVHTGEVLVAPIAVGIVPAPPQKRCAPKGCGGCGGCMALASVPNGYARRFAVPVDAVNGAADYKLGDRVGYTRFIPEPNLMSALIFGLPVAFAMAAMLCCLTFAPQGVESPSAALCIAAAFFTAILIVGTVNNLFKKKYPATITTAKNYGGIDNDGTDLSDTDCVNAAAPNTIGAALIDRSGSNAEAGL